MTGTEAKGMDGKAANDGPGAAPAAAPRFRVGITLTITACILIIVALGVGMVTWQQWDVAKRNTEELTRRNASLVIGQVDVYLKQFLDPVADYVDHMPDHAITAGWHHRPDDIPDDVLLASIAAVPAIRNAGLLFFEGRDVRLENHEGVGVLRNVDRTNDPTYEDLRALLSTALEARWSRPIFDTLLDAALIKSWHAVRQADRYFGAWYAGVPLTAISQAVADVGERFGGTAFVLTDDGKVLAHPNMASKHPDQGPGKPTVGIGRVGDIVLDGIWRMAKEVRECDCLTSGLATVEVTLDGTAYTGFFRRIFRYTDQPWIIGVWFVAADLQKHRDRLIAAAWTGAALILAALLLAGLAGNAIARPIRRSAAAVATIGRMDVETADRLPPSRITELNELATSYNNMRAALELFETYVPRSLVRRLVASDRHDVESSERQLTVMFTDIVGFTTIAEGQTPAQLAALVNEHFDILGACVEKHGGTIDKYIGDALMAFWGGARGNRRRPGARVLLRHGHGRRAGTRQPPARQGRPAAGEDPHRHPHGRRPGRQHRRQGPGQLHDHRRHREHLSADREPGPRRRQQEGGDHPDQRQRRPPPAGQHAVSPRRQLHRQGP